jgi:hypothetical protein
MKYFLRTIAISLELSHRCSWIMLSDKIKETQVVAGESERKVKISEILRK